MAAAGLRWVRRWYIGIWDTQYKVLMGGSSLSGKPWPLSTLGLPAQLSPLRGAAVDRASSTRLDGGAWVGSLSTL